MEVLFNIEALSIVKGFLIFFLVLYIVFALVVVRQVQLMVDTLNAGFEGKVKLLGYAHLIFAVGTLILAIIVL